MGLVESISPRRDVLDGELTEARFAASLEEVVTGTAPEAYGTPSVFFASTHPAGGLKSLLNEAMGRVTGGRPDAASVIRLETNLGGGKTHNLIALYQAVRGGLTVEQAAELMDPSLLPKAPLRQVGVFVGTSSGASSFPPIDGVAAKTIWGYLALQLGGPSGYELVRSDDESLTAPGSDAIKRLLGDEPSLILIDEIARYYAVAKGVAVGETTLAGQTTAFLMALMEAVDALPHAVLIITTTGLTDAFGEDTADVLTAIDEARELMARKELVLRPSEEADLPRILARRLFEPIPTGTAGAVAQAYAQDRVDLSACNHFRNQGAGAERVVPLHRRVVQPPKDPTRPRRALARRIRSSLACQAASTPTAYPPTRGRRIQINESSGNRGNFSSEFATIAGTVWITMLQALHAGGTP
jgi:predicted AAA+ superfamily ATPase